MSFVFASIVGESENILSDANVTWTCNLIKGVRGVFSIIFFWNSPDNLFHAKLTAVCHTDCGTIVERCHPIDGWIYKWSLNIIEHGSKVSGGVALYLSFRSCLPTGNSRQTDQHDQCLGRLKSDNLSDKTHSNWENILNHPF